jgi:hypothetical protein
MKDFFYAIQDLFVNVLFAPYDMLARLELTNWFGANIMSWAFSIIGMVLFVYWMLQLNAHATNGEEDKSITSHSYL